MNKIQQKRYFCIKNNTDFYQKKLRILSIRLLTYFHRYEINFYNSPNIVGKATFFRHAVLERL